MAEPQRDEATPDPDSQTLPSRPALDDTDLATCAPGQSTSDFDLPTIDSGASSPQEERGPRMGAAPPRRLGDYELLDEIARGGMGVVFRARQVSLNRIVAVKTILTGALAGEEEIQRFRAEAEAAANLEHSAIVPVYEVGRRDDWHYFSMGFVDGGSLADRLRDGPWPARDAATCLREVADAVAYAHRQGVIHRDLKPANILLDSLGRPHVTDFGLAKRLSAADQVTTTGQILGTPAFMPPEQALGDLERIGPASDIYSLGAVLYMATTGRPPHAAGNPLDTLLLVRTAEPLPPRSLNPSLPRDLETIILKCLAKEPSRRYDSAEELVAELDRFLAGEPILARRVGRVERTWRWCRRHPAIAGLSASLGLLLLTLAVVGPWVAVRQSQLRSQAEQNEDRATRLAGEREDALQAANTAGRQLAESKATAEQALYARTVSLAYQEWLSASVPRARDLLQATDQSRRGWEWRFVDRLCRADLAELRGVAGVPATVALSADGTQAFAGGLPSGPMADHHLYRWQVDSGELIASPAAHVLALSRDGRLAVTMRDPGASRFNLWDVEHGVELASFEAHRGGTLFGALDREGRRVATVGADQRVVVWDVERRVRVLDVEEAGRRKVHRVALSDDGQLVAWRGVDDGVVQWRRLGEPDSQPLTYAGSAEGTADASPAFSPDGATLAVPQGNEVVLLDVATGDAVGTLDGHDGTILSLDFSPDGRRLVSSATDSTIRVYDVAARRQLLRLIGHGFGLAYGVTAARFSPDGARIVSGAYDQTVRVWDAWGEDRMAERLFAAQEPLPVAPDLELDWLATPGRMVQDLACSPDGSLVALAGNQGLVEIWDSDAAARRHVLDVGPRDIAALAFLPDGKSIVLGQGSLNQQEPGEVLLWTLADGKVARRFDKLSGPVSRIAVVPPQRLVVAAIGSQAKVSQGELVAWDWETGEERWRTGEGEFAGVRGLAVAPDGSWLAASDYTGRIIIVEAATGRPQRNVGRVGGRYVAYSLAVSPDGRSLYAGGSDWGVRRLDVDTGEELWSRHEHSGAVMDLAAHADEERLFSVGLDGATRVWDGHGECLLTMRGDRESLLAVAIDSAGRRVVSAGSSAAVALRDAGPTDDAQELDHWETLFADDFERAELGEDWWNGQEAWALEQGAARGRLAASETDRGFQQATLVLKRPLPRDVEISYDIWTDAAIACETKLHDATGQRGLAAVLLETRTPFNRGELGAALLLAPRYTESASRRDVRWLADGRRHRVRSLRQGDRWELYVDERLVLACHVRGLPALPKLHLQGSFGVAGDTLRIDNLRVRVSPEGRAESTALGVVERLFQDHPLPELVIARLREQPNLSEEQVAIAERAAKSWLASPERYLELVGEWVFKGEPSPEDAARVLAHVDALARPGGEDADELRLRGALAFHAQQWELALRHSTDAAALDRERRGAPHPIDAVIVATASLRLGQTERAAATVRMLDELQRARRWAREPRVQTWLAKLPPELAERPARPPVVDELARITWRIQAALHLDNDSAPLRARLAADATRTFAASERPSDRDLIVDRQSWLATDALLHSAVPDWNASLVRDQFSVQQQGVGWNVRERYTQGDGAYYFTYQLSNQWIQEEGEWKLASVRMWPVAFSWDGERFQVDASDHRRLDAFLAERREQLGERASLALLPMTGGFRELLEGARRLTESPDASGLDWALLASAASFAGDEPLMLAAARRSVELDPQGGAGFLRALATRESRAPRAAIGGGVTTLLPEFYTAAQPRAIQFPGQVQACWYPDDNSVALVSRLPRASLGESLDAAADTLTKAFQRRVYRRQLDELPPKMLLGFEGPGTGRALLGGAGGVPTTMVLVVLEQQEDWLLFVACCPSPETTGRGSELLEMARSVAPE